MPAGAVAGPGLVALLCLVAMLGASDVLVRGLDRLGARLGLTEGLLGLLTALGADAPEIAAAVAAIRAGNPDVGVGVVLGSNLFNLAALLGLGAVLAGRVRVHREGLVLDAGVSLTATVLVAALLLHLLPPAAAVLLLAVLLVPYVVALGTAPARLARLPLPWSLARLLAVAVRELDHETAEDPRVSGAAGPGGSAGGWGIVWFIPAALAVIVAGSSGLVDASLSLARSLDVPTGLVGVVLLAGLTSLPNAYAAARLATQGRGAAVVSETFNSNTINVLVGVGLPALAFGVRPVTRTVAFDLAWLLGLTVAVIALLARPRGLRRRDGVGVIVLYACFVVLRVTIH